MMVPCRTGYHAARDTMPHGMRRIATCTVNWAPLRFYCRTEPSARGLVIRACDSSLPLSAAAARVGTQSTCVCEYSVVPCEYGLHSLHRKIALPAAGAYSVAVFSWPSTTQKVHCSHTAPRRTNRTQIPFKARAETTRNPPLSSLLSESVGVGRGRHLQGRLR